MEKPKRTPRGPPMVQILPSEMGRLDVGAVIKVGKEEEMEGAPGPMKIPYAAIVQRT
jgi:hypothetical protein